MKEKTMIVIYKVSDEKGITKTSTENIGDDLMDEFKKSIAREILEDYFHN